MNCILMFVFAFVLFDVHLIVNAGQIKTTEGNIVCHSQRTSSSGIKVAVFKGIPFARPPVGRFRFEDPTPPAKYSNNELCANEFKSKCLQPSMGPFGDHGNKSEDCLYLNIYVPNMNVTARSKPVMVWLHGGGFTMGSGSETDATELAATGDIIVVTINYRLGIFGFLASGDETIKGNFGLKDQRAALLWIKQNIKSFIGDPNRVTLFGESAGAAAVGFHYLRRSEFLFNKVIMQSSTPLKMFLPDTIVKKEYLEILHSTNCWNSTDKPLCLKYFTGDELLEKSKRMQWKPFIDGDFILQNPYKETRDFIFKDIDVLAGFNKDEGSFFLILPLRPPMNELLKDHNTTEATKLYKQLAEMMIREENSTEVLNIINQYEPEFEYEIVHKETLLKAIIELQGDGFSKCLMKEWLEAIYKFTPARLYFYQLNYRAVNTNHPKYVGVTHTDDLQWVFGHPMTSTGNYISDEVKFSKTIMKYWTNFAKTGNPNSRELSYWREFPAYLEMTENGNFVTEEIPSVTDKCKYWRKLYEKTILLQ